MHRIILLFTFLFISLVVQATGGRFEFTPAARAAYDKVTSLRLEEARAELELIKTNDPENLIAYHIENYIDLFTIFINEDEQEFDRLEKNKSRRLDKIRSGDKNSPYYLYTQAEIKLQWALVRLKFGEYITALMEIKSAYKQLEKNEKKFPAFVPNKKSLSIMHAMIGTVPDNYRWGVKFLSGMDGTIEQGLGEMKEVLEYASNNDFIFEQEAMVMHAFLMLHLNNKDAEAWNLISESKLNPQESSLACFALANLAMRTGRNDEAIRILEQRPKNAAYHPFHYLDYMLGLAKLHRLDSDADVYIQKFLNNFRGKNYIKEAYQKLAWNEIVRDNPEAYHKYMKACKANGHTTVESDKTANKEAKLGVAPNKILLKARLLFDGGYYQKAYDLLQPLSNDDFTSIKTKLEHHYRLGRITHNMKRHDEAIKYYSTTIDKGARQSYFYACNSALQLGKMYEGLEQYSAAKKFYKKCLSLSPDEYKNGLHQQAKAGLNRLRKK